VTLTPTVLRSTMPTLTEGRAATWAPCLTAAASEFGIDTPGRLAMWLAHLAVESGELRRLVENLSYSAGRMIVVWPSRFGHQKPAPGERSEAVAKRRATGRALAERLAHKPEELAEHVYGMRADLGNTKPGDGWLFRGRGAIMTTGGSNYRRTGQGLGLDLETYPDLLQEIETAARAAGWFWQDRSLNRYADAGDLRGGTRRVNGGLTGLAERESYWRRCRLALGLSAGVVG
jgi:putative chitinase